MNASRAVTQTLFVALLSLGLYGCGGGGGGSDSTGGSGSGRSTDTGNVDNDNASGGGDDSVPELSGLDSDANNQDLLFFSHSFETDTGTTSTLYAIDPANPDVSTPLALDIREAAQGPGEVSRASYVPLYEADIDDAGGVENYRVSDVLFLHNRESGNATSEGFARVSTDPTTPEPVRVSSETYARAGLVGAGILVRQNYANADHSGVVYGLPGAERRVRSLFEASDSPQMAFSATVQHVTPLGEDDSPDRQRHLVLRTQDDTECSEGLRLTANSASALPGPGAGIGSSLSGVNAMPGETEVASAAALGKPFDDGSQYLVIETLTNLNISGRPCVSDGGTVWRYVPDTAPAIRQVLNDNGDPLTLPEGVAGPMLPAERHIARNADTLFFGVTGVAQTSPQAIYRLEGSQWSLISEEEENLGFTTGFVLTAGDRVVASVGNTVVSWDTDGNDRQELDASDAAWLGIQTTVLGSRDGWFYYTRTNNSGQDTAVAMKADGSEIQEFAGAQWIGASITGSGESISAMAELSEVFLWSGREIAAISAAAPSAGSITLGDLGSVPDAVTMYGLAPGPHRLVQVHPDSDNSYVYHIDTRAAGSLTQALDQPGIQRPVNGF